ncbi:MAG TPA: hypothetical protein VGA67_00930 [Candidatus Dojkabacteria bacterium]|jgi:hypothetical protein
MSEALQQPSFEESNAHSAAAITGKAKTLQEALQNRSIQNNSQFAELARIGNSDIVGIYSVRFPYRHSLGDVYVDAEKSITIAMDVPINQCFFDKNREERVLAYWEIDRLTNNGAFQGRRIERRVLESEVYFMVFNNVFEEGQIDSGDLEAVYGYNEDGVLCNINFERGIQRATPLDRFFSFRSQIGVVFSNPDRIIYVLHDHPDHEHATSGYSKSGFTNFDSLQEIENDFIRRIEIIFQKLNIDNFLDIGSENFHKRMMVLMKNIHRDLDLFPFLYRSRLQEKGSSINEFYLITKALNEMRKKLGFNAFVKNINFTSSEFKDKLAHFVLLSIRTIGGESDKENWLDQLENEINNRNYANNSAVFSDLIKRVIMDFYLCHIADEEN